MEKQKDIDRSRKGQEHGLMPWGDQTTTVLTAETRRLCDENHMAFKWFYLTPELTIIATKFPMSSTAMERLKRLGYTAIDDEMVVACGLNHDPKKRAYFGIDNDALREMHLS